MSQNILTASHVCDTQKHGLPYDWGMRADFKAFTEDPFKICTNIFMSNFFSVEIKFEKVESWHFANARPIHQNEISLKNVWRGEWKKRKEWKRWVMTSEMTKAQTSTL